MINAYKKELRTNRQRFLSALRTKYGDLPPDVEKLYLQKMTAIQNETRGKLGELFGEVSLTANGMADESDIFRDTVVFSTPYGKRRIDVWHDERKHALEVKSGYACLSKIVRNQIRKDKFLMENGTVACVSWRLMKGGSTPLINILEANKIEVLLGWPDLDDLPLVD